MRKKKGKKVISFPFMKNIIRYIFCNDSVGELYMGDCKFPDWMDNGETIPLKLCSRLQSFERLLR